MSLSITEAEARLLLRYRYAAAAGSAAWIAGQRWQAGPGGWIVNGKLEGWHFRIEAIPGGLRIRAGEPGMVPATWTVTG